MSCGCRRSSTPTSGRSGRTPTRAVVTGFLDPHLRGFPGDYPQQQLTTDADVTVRHDVSGVRDWWLAKPSAEQATLQREFAAARS